MFPGWEKKGGRGTAGNFQNKSEAAELKVGEQGKSHSADVEDRLPAGEKNRSLQEVVVQLRCFAFLCHFKKGTKL